MEKETAIKLSIVVPVYKGEEFLRELTERILQVCRPVFGHLEIIYVNDASPDESWFLIKKLCQEYPELTGINFSRNFGQHYAITAGLAHASGEWLCVMDCDLQDRPEEIPRLYAKAREGYDIVHARRRHRSDHFRKRQSSRIFYKIFGYLTDSEQDAGIANFGIYHHKVIAAILQMGDRIRFFPTMIQWVGFNRTTLEVQHAPRASGTSSYNWGKLLRLAFNNIIAFSDKPLYLTIGFGFSITLISFLIGLFYLFKYLAGDIAVSGFTSIILSISFFSGVIIAILGMLGIYLGKTFDQTKDRPLYIINEIIKASRDENVQT